MNWRETGLRTQGIRIGTCISAALVLAAVMLVVPAWAAEQSSTADVSAGGSWVNHIGLYGDFRGRAENFWYEGTKSDRHRLRYRLRVGLKAKVNEYVKFDARLATGSDANPAPGSTSGRRRKSVAVIASA